MAKYVVCFESDQTTLMQNLERYFKRATARKLINHVWIVETSEGSVGDFQSTLADALGGNIPMAAIKVKGGNRWAFSSALGAGSSALEML